MNTPLEIRQLAKERLEEATILAANQKFDGAFYLAGYSVELMLKAKICDLWDIPNLFAEGNNNSQMGVSYLRKAVQIHDLNVLLFFSGLKKDFDKDKINNRFLNKAINLLFNAWSEKSRYKPCGFHKDNDVKALIKILSDPNKGLLQWIENK